MSIPTDKLNLFQIQGDRVTGEGDLTLASQFGDEVSFLEDHAREIGRALGMISVQFGYASLQDSTFGYRFASSSGEDFDAKGAIAEESVPPKDLLDAIL